MFLPDTRPYPTDPVKNDLLLYAGQIAAQTSKAQTNLAQEHLQAQISQMLAQRHFLSLSVAMSMAPSVEVYSALYHATAQTLQARNDDEVQWFALPVVLVAGSKQARQLRSDSPQAQLAAVLANYPALRPLSEASFLPQLLRAEDFAAIKADNWFHAKQSPQAAAAFAQSLPVRGLDIPQDQSVHVVYALGYGNRNLQAALGSNLRDAALPLMQLWIEHLSQPGLTLFANPLNADNPLNALALAGHMRRRMALDVFAANAIRAVRLQSPRVGVVAAARQDGSSLLFGFGAAESSYGLQSQTFVWPLSPHDDIAQIEQNFLDLMTDCQVDAVRLLHEPLPENRELPDFESALELKGSLPLLEYSRH